MSVAVTSRTMSDNSTKIRLIQTVNSDDHDDDVVALVVQSFPCTPRYGDVDDRRSSSTLSITFVTCSGTGTLERLLCVFTTSNARRHTPLIKLYTGNTGMVKFTVRFTDPQFCIPKGLRTLLVLLGLGLLLPDFQSTENFSFRN